jgi:hypothetical protein
MMNTNFDPARRQPKGVLAQVLTLIFSLVALGAAFMFSLVFFAVLAVAGLIFWLYFWWKTRELRRQIRARQSAGMGGGPGAPEPGAGASAGPAGAAGSGDIIEGEAVRVADERDRLSK